MCVCGYYRGGGGGGGHRSLIHEHYPPLSSGDQQPFFCAFICSVKIVVQNGALMADEYERMYFDSCAFVEYDQTICVGYQMIGISYTHHTPHLIQTIQLLL